MKLELNALSVLALSVLALLSLLFCVNGLARTPSQAQVAEVPDWVNFPGNQWESITPEQAGLDPVRFNDWVNSQNPQFGILCCGQQPEDGGVVIARGGYIIHTWGDPDFKYQSASLGKTFTRMVLQLAVDEGLIGSKSDLVKDYWTGVGQLNSPHKYLNNGYHQTLTFSHLENMIGGFPVSNGYCWRTGTATGWCQPIPDWANWTGDPDYDNYAHVAPGTHHRYSSGGYWRLSQALTAIWNKDKKQVLDEKIMSKIGIPADRWDWVSGEYVRTNVDFYPDIPGYGDYLDPPYTINGEPVLGGGGWVVMSAKDFARVGLLIATGGEWNGQQLISNLGGNVGVSSNTVDGWGVVNGKDGYFSFGKVTTGSFSDPTPNEMASWIIGPVKSSKIYLPIVVRR
jgi:CubicO group peptidase (beta-lactamase class C family)